MARLACTVRRHRPATRGLQTGAARGAGRPEDREGQERRLSQCEPACVADAWRIGLAALDDESLHRHRAVFADLGERERVGLVQALEHGTLSRDAWRGMPSKLFFTQRVLHDICTTYYSHPSTWSAIGFGGPANPRGYVRMTFNRRDPWEARETGAAHDDTEAQEKQRAR